MNKNNRNYALDLLKQKRYVAHRGLFNPAEGRPENSLPAFRHAVENNYPIELDVQLTRDRKLVVFHDETLTRMCGIDKKVRDCSYEEILTYRLGDSDEVVPLFSEVLKVVDGKIPMIVEIKSEGDWKATTMKTACMLDAYKGPFVVESFHPLVVNWLRKYRPEFVRGQLSSDFKVEAPEKGPVADFLLTHLFFNLLTRPDFVAYNHLYRDKFPLPSLKKKGRVCMVAWTIRSRKQLEENREFFDVFIFDSFIPV